MPRMAASSREASSGITGWGASGKSASRAKWRLGPVGQEADLQALQVVPHLFRGEQQHRHHHQGAPVVRHALLEEQLGQHPRGQQAGGEVVDQLHRHLARRQEQQQPQGEQGRRPEPGPGRRASRPRPASSRVSRAIPPT